MAKKNETAQVKDFNQAIQEHELSAGGAQQGAPSYKLDDAPPEGWESANDPEIDGWIQMDEPGAGVVGILKGHKTLEDDERDMRVVLIELQRPAKAMVGERGDYQISVLEPGKVGALYIKAKTEALWEYEKGTEVWVRAKDKIAIGKGKTMWQIDCFVKPGSKKRVQPVTTSGGTDDLPPELQ